MSLLELAAVPAGHISDMILATPDGPGHPSSPSAVKCSETHGWKPVWVWVGWEETVHITQFLWQDSVPVSCLNKSKLHATDEPGVNNSKVCGWAVCTQPFPICVCSPLPLHTHLWNPASRSMLLPGIPKCEVQKCKPWSCSWALCPPQGWRQMPAAAAPRECCVPALGCASFSLWPAPGCVRKISARWKAATWDALGLCRRRGTPSHLSHPLEILFIPALWFGEVIFLMLSNTACMLGDLLLCDPSAQSNSEHFLLMVLGHPRKCLCLVKSVEAEILICAVGLSLEPVAEKMHLFSSKHPICIQMQALTIVWTCCRCWNVAPALGVNNTSKRKHSHEAFLMWPQRLSLLLWKCMLMRELLNKPPLFYCTKCVAIGAFCFWLSKWAPCSLSALYMPVGRVG